MNEALLAKLRCPKCAGADRLQRRTAESFGVGALMLSPAIGYAVNALLLAEGPS